MEILEKLRQFLLGFPGLEDLSADFTQDGPGNSGLFPGGVTEVDRRKDLLGNTYVTYECLFTLYKRLEPGQDSAQWLLDFQSWLAERTDVVLVRKAKTQEALYHPGSDLRSSAGSHPQTSHLCQTLPHRI